MHEPLRDFRSSAAGSNWSFGLVMAGAFGVVGCAPILRGHEPRWISIIAAILFLVLTVLWPASLGPANRLWFQFSRLISRFTTPLVMGILFFGIITPVGILMRLTGVDTLGLMAAPERDSYWIPRNPVDPTSAERLF